MAKQRKGIIKKVLVGVATVAVLATAYFGITHMNNNQNTNNNEPPITNVTPNIQQQTPEQKEKVAFEDFTKGIENKLTADTLTDSAKILHLDIKDNEISIVTNLYSGQKEYLVIGTYTLSSTPANFQEAVTMLSELESQKFDFVPMPKNAETRQAAMDFYNSSNIGGRLVEIRNSGDYELLNAFGFALDRSDYGHCNFEATYMFQEEDTGKIVIINSTAVMGVPTHSQLLLFEQEGGRYSEIHYQYHQVKNGNYEYREDSVNEFSEFGVYFENMNETSTQSNTF